MAKGDSWKSFGGDVTSEDLGWALTAPVPEVLGNFANGFHPFTSAEGSAHKREVLASLLAYRNGVELSRAADRLAALTESQDRKTRMLVGLTWALVFLTVGLLVKEVIAQWTIAPAHFSATGGGASVVTGRRDAIHPR